MRKSKAFMIGILSAVILSGCTKSNILSSGDFAGPVFDIQEGIELDWNQINTDMDEEFVDNEEYPMALSVNYNLDKEKKLIEMVLMVKQGTTKEEAVEFADAAVRFLNDEIAIQDFSYENSSNQSYGGFFKEYDLDLIVMPDYSMEKEEYWLVDMEIPKGSDSPIVAKEGAVIMETEAAFEEE